MNRVSFRISAIATMAALSALVFSTACAGTAAAQSTGGNGVIYACFKAKGKSKGALRVVPQQNGCKKLRGGWRPVSWSANGSSGASGQNGSNGAAGTGGAPGSKGDPGPEGKEGPQGLTGKVEQSLIETIQTQTTQINGLTKQVSDLTGELNGLEGIVTGLEGTVGDACEQLSTVTDQTDEIADVIAGLGLNNALKLLGGLLEVPTLPAALGTFECI